MSLSLLQATVMSRVSYKLPSFVECVSQATTITCKWAIIIKRTMKTREIITIARKSSSAK